MEPEPAKLRYEMTNVQPGWIVVEEERFSHEARAYFHPGPNPPVEEYREEGRFWKSTPAAQSFRFDLRDAANGEVIPYPELLGLIYWASSGPDSEIHQIGDMAQEHRISVYVAVAYEKAGRTGPGVPLSKLRILNRYFNERVRQPGKKILILPDYFGLYRGFSTGQIMADLGLTAMEPSAESRESREPREIKKETSR